MNVLLAGECSGVVRDAFRRRGHDAISCDLKPTEVEGPHIICNYMLLDWRNFELIIIHPDCTYLCSSGLHWNARRPERAILTEKAVEFVFKVRDKLDESGADWALENPIGCLSSRWRKPDQIVQPWQFGDDASKATCLWTKGLPALRHTGVFPPRIVDGKRRWGNQTDSGQNKLAPSDNRPADRARTYPGIAEAMADQWGNHREAPRQPRLLDVDPSRVTLSGCQRL